MALGAACALFGGACTGRRVDLARPPGARAGQADATGRRRQRRLGLRPRRVRPRPPVQLGVEDRRACSPRTRSCSRRRRCSTGSGRTGGSRPRVYPQKHSDLHRHAIRGNLVLVGAGDPALASSGFAKHNNLPVTPLGALAKEVKQGRHQAGDRQGARRRQRLRPPARRPDERGRRIGRARPRSPASPTTRASSTATMRPAPSWSQSERSPTSSAITACRSKKGTGRGQVSGAALRHRPLAKRHLPQHVVADHGDQSPLEQLLRRDAPEAPGAPNGKHVGTTSRGAHKAGTVRAASWERRSTWSTARGSRARTRPRRTRSAICSGP